MSIELIPIGRTNKTYGVDGTLRITVKDAFFEDFVAAEVVFLETGGQPAPFFIEDRWGGDVLYLKLEEIDSREAARVLTDKVLSLRKEDVQAPPAHAPAGTIASAYTKWIGYTIFDQELGEVGVIENIIELPEQLLANLIYQGQEIMIPLHEDLIVAVDQEKKSVTMDLPEGLLAL